MSYATFPDFLESLRLPNSAALSPSKMSEVLELPAQEMASLARVHRNTLSGAPNSSRVQTAMRDIVRVLSAASGFCGDFDKAVFWFRNHPLPDLNHLTPLQLVERGKAESVIEYIGSLEAGASG